MSAEEGLRLLDGASHFDFRLIDSTDEQLSVEASLVDLLDNDALPLSGLEQFLEDVLVPDDSVGLHQIDIAEHGLDLGDAFLLELLDDDSVVLLQALRQSVEFFLETDSFLDEGGQGLG